MRWIKDPTGRYPRRPYYAEDELDAECEAIIQRLLTTRRGGVQFPVTTDDLTVLIESEAEELDLYADLSGEEGQVEGVTEFRSGRKPCVLINRELTEAPHLGNRLRTTLAHEYGHVHFHGFLHDLEDRNLSLFEAEPKTVVIKSRRETIEHMPASVDWMEWQAWYACGALLMPTGALRQVTKGFFTNGGNGEEGLVACIADHFQVSRDAARVRLSRAGFLREDRLTDRMF